MNISACLIVKNDAARLRRAVASIRAYVDEVVIVDTGSTDGTAEAAFTLADKFERFTVCNFPDGEIADFSAARNRSLELASNDCVLWLDADDVILGGEHIQEAIAWCQARDRGQPWRAKFAYEYDHDADGRCIALQRRERIVYPKSEFHWAYRVHEGLTCKRQNEWQTLEPPQAVVWKHDMDRKKSRSGRNLRILRDHIKQVGVENVDAKTQFDFAGELAKSGDHLQAMAWLTRFVETSDLADERFFACLQAIDVLAFWPGREQDAAVWGHRAVEIHPEWAEGYWALAKLAHTCAIRYPDNERRHLDRAAHFARQGLAKSTSDTDIALNPQDRAGNVQALLFDVETRRGNFEAALEAARACLAARPHDVTVKLHVAEAEARAHRAAVQGLDIVIACGVTAEAWDPGTAAKTGIGGSETAVIEVAKRLAASGARVRVFCRCFTAGIYDGVEYRPMNESEQASGCDILIAWRNASLLEATPAKAKWLWLHDVSAFGATAWNLTLADRILTLSEWHAEHVRALYPAVAGKICVTRNGIDLARFADEAVGRHPRRAIYSSSPDRGLEQLLAMWPAIRARVPDAELRVFYGWQYLSAEYRAKVEAQAAAAGGVELLGRVDQATLAREMLAAGAWLYPSWAGDKAFTETSCITAMEAQAAGLRIVTSTYGALPETVRYGVQVPGDATEPEYQVHFVDAAVVALTQDATLWRPVSQAYAREHFSWDGVAAQWAAWMAEDAVRAAPTVTAARDGRPVLHMVLAPQASGNVPMDAAGDPGSEAHGGGSRVGFIGLVRAMAEIGTYDVRAFSTFTAPHVRRSGADYFRLDLLSSQPAPDAVLAYYDTSPLSTYDARKTLRIASHHTYSPYMHFDFADVNTAPSEHAMRYLRDRFDPTGEWRVLPNGVGESAIVRTPVPGRVIYHTSPDRGLHILLESWPLIRRAMPHATLHVVGPVEEYLGEKRGPGKEREQTRRMLAAIGPAQAAGGVSLLGRLPRADLWRELGEASLFAFPCQPTGPCETFSISIMECCKAGIPVVLAPDDALGSIYAGHVRMASHEPAAFGEAVVDVLTSEAEQSRLIASGKDLAREYTFERQAAALDRIIREQSPAMHRLHHVGARYEGDVLAAVM